MPGPIRREQLDIDVPSGATNNPCRLASTGSNLTLSGLSDIDGVTPVADDRILVKDQSTGSQNGIYVAAVGAWSRAEDFDENEDVDPGSITPVAEGTANGGTMWQLTTADPITLGTTALTFEIIGSAGTNPGAHAANHLPSGSDPITTAAAVGLNADSANGAGTAESIARSDHTHSLDTTNGTISTINGGDTATEGTGTGLSRRDHQHAVATGGATASIDPDDAAAEGTSANLAREDHQHAIVTAAGANGIGAGNTEGTASSFSRSDHDHALRESGGQDLTLGAITAGQLVERVGTTLVGTTEIDDTQHGNRGGGSLHSVATTGVAGFMSPTDKVKLDSLQDAAGIDAKESVKCRAQGNLTLSGEQTIDGVLTSTSRVLVDSQTTASEDGIYVTAAGAWSRSTDMATGTEARGSIVHVEEGTTDGDKLFQCTNNEGSDVVGTDGLTFAQIGAGSPRGAGAGLVLNGNDLDVVANADGSIVVNANDIQVGVLANDTQHGVRGGGTQHAAATTGVNGFMSAADKTKLDGIDTGATATTPRQEELTTQAINSADTALTDTLDNTPYSDASVSLFFNGVHMIQGAGKDYSISGTTITWLRATGTAPKMKTSDTLVAVYMS